MNENKKIMIGISFVALALILVVGSLLFFLQQPNEENIGVKLGYKKHLGYLPIFVGIEKGFYQQEGLSVDAAVFDSTNQMLGAVASGNIDGTIGAANLETIFGLEEKSPNTVKIFTTVDIDDTSMFSCVMVKAGSTLEKLADLKHSKIGTMQGSFSTLFTVATLNTADIAKSDVEITEIASELQLPALESGQVDALVTLEPACTFGVNKGIGKIIYKEPMKNLAPTFAASVLSAEFVKKSPDAAKKIVAGTDRAIDFIKANPQESIEILAKYAGYKKELISGMKPPIYSKSREINVDNLQELADRLYKSGILKKQTDASRMIYG